MRECFEVTTAMHLLFFFFFFLREMRGIGRNEARKAIVLFLLVGVRDRDTQKRLLTDDKQTGRQAKRSEEGAVIYPFR